ncbi:MAG: hypothetical protein J6O09_02400 [Lachnospiraceae bacterium]|nr:hypothetical protein [Lachnospiraceae bacterium]
MNFINRENYINILIDTIANIIEINYNLNKFTSISNNVELIKYVNSKYVKSKQNLYLNAKVHSMI